RRPTACEDGGRLGESQHSQAPDAPAGASPTNQLISSSLPAPVSRFRLPIHLRRSGNRKQPAISFLQIHQLSLKQVHQLSWPLILPGLCESASPQHCMPFCAEICPSSWASNETTQCECAIRDVTIVI